MSHNLKFQPYNIPIQATFVIEKRTMINRYIVMHLKNNACSTHNTVIV